MCVTCVLGFLQLPRTEYTATPLVPIPRLNVKGKDLGLPGAQMSSEERS